jgi:hypothetical protein
VVATLAVDLVEMLVAELETRKADLTAIKWEKKLEKWKGY